MATSLIDEIAAKAAALPPEEQREVLRIVEALAQHSESKEEDPYTLPPLVTDETERARLLEETVQEMKNHPLVGDPPPLTRDELHERR